ncbi:Putative Propionyl-CoA carboxylase alpha chain [Rhizopus microsporus]|nr:Putative Propionyl-CoA carboxylase alpha chain [Rhizopus microsporus]
MFVNVLKRSIPILIKRQVPQCLVIVRNKRLHTTPLSKYTRQQSCLFSTVINKPCKKTFQKLLIANRGEIACRIIKTAKKMGIKTVAIYTDLDANALHVQMADESVHVGQSYLSIPAVLRAIEQTGAEAVHPGYGFLSENPMFVKQLEERGIVFVGPKASAIAAMGDKIQSKLIAKASGVNCIPGYDGEIKDVEEAVRMAETIGYPVMIKASAGGGGKGMRIAWNPDELRDGFKLAKQESKSSFDDDRMLIEKYIDHPRHIEVQVLGDNYGNVVYLPERECSIQRRNQKVIEESPSIHLDPETRRRMGEQAVALAKHVGYNSAGTVEFLVDMDKNFYFLEMNTRLQVEHPITEYVTQLDLVEHMLYSAANHPLNLRQDDVILSGWAFESRVYAEDPTNYLPSVGRLLTYREPQMDQVRCDSGFIEGSEMHLDYDPLICKLATYGKTRQEALERMLQALDGYVIKGVTHNIPLLRGVFSHPRFQDGKKITTHFLSEEYPNGFRPEWLDKTSIKHIAALTSAMWFKKELSYWRGPNKKTVKSMWVEIEDEDNNRDKRRVDIEHKGNDLFMFKTESQSFEFSLRWPLDSLLAHSCIDHQEVVIQYLDKLRMGFRIQYRGNKYRINIYSPEQEKVLKYMEKKEKTKIENKRMMSPMAGKIVSVSIKEGEQVKEGNEMVIVEAMKMQNSLRTPQTGVVKKIHVQPGSTVKSGQILIEFE